MVEVVKKRIIGRSVVFCEKVTINRSVTYYVEACGNDWRVWKKIFGADRHYALHIYHGYCFWAWIIEAMGQDPVAVRLLSWLMHRMFR